MQKLVKNHGIALIVWIGIILISIFSLPNIDQLVSVVNTIKRVKDVFSVERIIQ